MLKYILAAGFLFSGSIAHAQNLTFDTSVSVEKLYATFKPAEAFNIAAQTQLRFGDFGLQADYSFSAINNSPVFATPTSPRISMELSVLGVHGSYSITNALRAGAFATYQFAPNRPNAAMYTVGAEAMVSFGKTDIEAAAAIEFPVNNVSNLLAGNLFLAAYHTVSPRLELSVETSAWVSDMGPISRIILASANVKYTLPTAPLSLKLGVENAYFTWRAPLTSIRIGVSYDFGTPSEFRAFGERGMDFAELTVGARS
ncbi:MAG: hypothetical protein COB08_006845 [Rhodobacteraceae bacterium]|nr:hypothetical protein [Paracoccaceae bacterium]